MNNSSKLGRKGTELIKFQAAFKKTKVFIEWRKLLIERSQQSDILSTVRYLKCWKSMILDLGDSTPLSSMISSFKN